MSRPDRKRMEHTNVKILAISDVPSKALWDYDTRARLEGIDLILSCGDLPKKYLEYLTNFTAAPILYVHGNHDGSYTVTVNGKQYYCADTHEFLHFLEDIGERWEDSEIRKR